MRSWHLFFVSVLAVGVVTAVSTEPRPQAGATASAAAAPALPMRLTTWAVSMGTVATGRNNVIDINIERWSTPQERETLIQAFEKKGQDGLLTALQKTKVVGRLRVPGITGPDPQQLRLGWDLHYAVWAPGDDGGHRLLIATDRYITFAEARNQPRSIDYPFTLIEIRLGKDGEGEGKAAVATKISVDKKKKAIELENYSSEPVRLQNVKVEK